MSEQVRRVWISTRAHDRATGEWLTVKGEVVPTDDYATLEAENAKLRAELERRAPDGWDVAGDILEKLSAAQAIIDGLRGEVADLYTTMMAAAVEIQEHWAAHCDEEGYGPANLMHRLERGIASQYGYSAETLVRLESQRDQQAQRIGELEGLLDRVKVSLSLDDTEWGYSAPEKYKLLADIRAALSAGKEGE